MEIFIATGNEHKVYEFRKMLEPLGYTIRSLNDLDDEVEIIENGTTFSENALIKAKTVSDKFSIPCIADDSGLEIDCLNKEPGIYSARYLGYDTDYDTKNNDLIRRTNEHDDRTARFVCAIALCIPNEADQVFLGTVEGEVAYAIKGDNGFGYDPIFYYPPDGKNLAEVSDEMKNAVSHRGKAIEQLVEYLEKR